jgi:putative ABC transport system permease protein
MAAGDGAIVIKQTAITFDYEVGDVIDIPGATPPLRLPIVAITDANAPTSGGMVNISHQLMAEHFGIDGFARYELQLEPDADRAGVRAGIQDIISPAAPTVGISTGAQFLEEFQRSTDQTLALVAMVLLVIVTCAAIAVLNTLLASVLERTGELAVLRAIGATRRRILTSVAYEALAIGLTGAILGVVAGCCYHAILVRRIRELTAFAVDYAFSPLTVAIAIITGVGIAAAGAAIPCRRVARMDLLDALAQ